MGKMDPLDSMSDEELSILVKDIQAREKEEKRKRLSEKRAKERALGSIPERSEDLDSEGWVGRQVSQKSLSEVFSRASDVGKRLEMELPPRYMLLVKSPGGRGSAVASLDSLQDLGDFLETMEGYLEEGSLVYVTKKAESGHWYLMPNKVWRVRDGGLERSRYG